MRSSAVFAVAAMLASTPCFGASTGGLLFAWCTSPEMTPEYVGCNLYIAGFVQALHLAGDKDKEGLVCLPVGLTGEEARAAFVRVMRSFGKSNSACEIITWLRSRNRGQTAISIRRSKKSNSASSKLKLSP
jgi:hypothetical protein